MSTKKEIEAPAIIDYKQYGLDKPKAEQITSAFSVNEVEHTGYMSVYGNLLTQEITEQTCKEAGELRRKLVKVRTNYDKIHKVEKAFYLAGGRFVDAYRNKKVAEVSLMEERLQEMENHFENLEKEKKDKIEFERKEKLKPFPELNLQFFDLRNMGEELFMKLLQDQLDLSAFKAKKLAEEEAEKKRAEEKAALEEQRKVTSMIYREFILDYDNIFLSDLSEEEFNFMIREAIGRKGDKEAEEERLRIENEKLKKEAEEKEKIIQASKVRQEKRLNEILKYNIPHTNKVDLSTLGELTEAEYLVIYQQKKKEFEAKLDIEIAERKKLDEAAAEERRKREKAEKELAEKNAAMAKAIKEAQEKVAAEKAAAEKAAKAPAKEKLQIWTDSIFMPNISAEGLNEDVLKVALDISEKFELFKQWAQKQIDKL